MAQLGTIQEKWNFASSLNTRGIELAVSEAPRFTAAVGIMQQPTKEAAGPNVASETWDPPAER